jgi:HAE1 family hydrophobic/amphiphilic exporter-1
VAFTLTTMMSSRWLARAQDAGGSSKDSRFFRILDGGYERLLRWAMAHRWVIVTASLVALVSIVPLFMAVGKDFLPKNDESQFEVSVRAPEGTTLEQTELIATRIGREIKRLPGVAYTVPLVGNDERRTANLASIFVKLTDIRKRQAAQFVIMDQVRKTVLPRFADQNLRTAVSQVATISGGGMSNREIAFYISGPDLQRLGEYSRRLTAALANVPGVVDIDTSLILGKPEMSVNLDRRKAAELGVQVADVADTLSVMVGGRKISTYNENGEQYEVHSRAVQQWRTTAEGVSQMAVPSSKLGAVSMDNVARFQEGEGPSQVDRIARRRQVTISANMQTGYDQQSALDALWKEVKAMSLDPAYQAGVMGASKEMGTAAVNFGLAFLLSIIFMYLILAAQFESWLHPVTILLALPLTVPFALLSILVFQQSLNIFTALGLLVLFGIVKKNSILQIDHMIGLRARACRGTTPSSRPTGIGCARS